LRGGCPRGGSTKLSRSAQGEKGKKRGITKEWGRDHELPAHAKGFKSKGKRARGYLRKRKFERKTSWKRKKKKH